MTTSEWERDARESETFDDIDPDVRAASEAGMQAVIDREWDSRREAMAYFATFKAEQRRHDEEFRNEPLDQGDSIPW